MNVLVTGADGFIGKNLQIVLGEMDDYELIPVTRSTSAAQLASRLERSDVVIHLAGVNRPQSPADFATGNASFTAMLCEALYTNSRSLPVAFASSIQAEQDNPYGLSKLAAEEYLKAYAEDTGAPVSIYRLANVFGKWSRPNYNSVVATFCHNISRGLPVQIDDPLTELRLIYVDDVISAFVRFINEPPNGLEFIEVLPEYLITVGELADQIRNFANVRTGLISERVGAGLVRALYATYVSYLEPQLFSYKVQKYSDRRGDFVEMLKTKDSGQFSFFTAHPGVTRGGHYHHTKTEKFLVINGQARFKFRHIITDEVYTLETSGDEPVIVESIPGWAHDITNIGDDNMIVMLWANEIFDRLNPDTISCKV